MAQDTDHLGRPIVVVTGMGVLTSLGQGQADNWKALTSGVSGIRRISRFPIDGLRTTIAGTVDFIAVPEPSAPALSQRLAELVIEEAVAEAAIGRAGDFPGPLFLALPPVEMEWTQRFALAAASGANETVTYDDLIRAAGKGGFEPYLPPFPVRFGGRIPGGPVRNERLAGRDIDGMRLGRDGDTARRRGDPPRRNRCRSGRRHGLLGQCGEPDPVLPAVGAIYPQRPAGFGIPARSARTARASSWPRAPARWCWKVWPVLARAAPTVLGVVEGCGEVADGFHRTRSSPDGKPIIACMRNALADAGLAPEAVDYINAHGTGTPENDKMEWVGVTAVFGDRAGLDPDVVEQVDDRAQPDRGGRGRGDLHAADDPQRAAAANDQLRHSGPGPAGRLRA